MEMVTKSLVPEWLSVTKNCIEPKAQRSHTVTHEGITVFHRKHASKQAKLAPPSLHEGTGPLPKYGMILDWLDTHTQSSSEVWH
eukprot:15069190-Heterocapsa_arctica.AAC.1